ncbi:MAG: hypothetical protein LBE12_12935 [Planctomycetaceae bacterium]|jgi:hypothetical protein|nr:hypothetical protein [Planctomycetaceae bacterium]
MTILIISVISADEDIIDSRVTCKLISGKSSFSPCEVIDFTMELKNVDSTALTLIEESTGFFSNTKIDAFYEDRPLLFTRHGIIAQKMSSWRIVGIDLIPDKPFNLKYSGINQYFDMTLSGCYTFQFKREIDSHPQKTYAVSNKLAVNVTDELLQFPHNFPLDTKSHDKNHCISLITNQEQYKYGDPIFLQVKTKNNKQKNISMTSKSVNIFDAYEMTLKTPGFNSDFRDTKERTEGAYHENVVTDAKLTLYGQKLFSEKSKESVPMVTVKPGEEVAETVIILNRIFDMSEDGIYGLIVSRKFIDENGKEQTVTSDPLPIRVGTALTQDEIDQRVKERQEKEKNTKK